MSSVRSPSLHSGGGSEEGVAVLRRTVFPLMELDPDTLYLLSIDLSLILWGYPEKLRSPLAVILRDL